MGRPPFSGLFPLLVIGFFLLGFVAEVDHNLLHGLAAGSLFGMMPLVGRFMARFRNMINRATP